MKILVLLFFLFVPTLAADIGKPPPKCTNVLEFVKILVPSENRNAVINDWRRFLNSSLKSNMITMTQYDARKEEILEAKRIIIDYEARGYKGKEVIDLAHYRCSV